MSSSLTGLGPDPQLQIDSPTHQQGKKPKGNEKESSKNSNGTPEKDDSTGYYNPRPWMITGNLLYLAFVFSPLAFSGYKKVQSKTEREIDAYHESGRVVASWLLEHTEPVRRVSIVPRGTAELGFLQYVPSGNSFMTKRQLFDTTCMLLGGGASEQVLLGEVSTRAQDDPEKVTKLAYDAIAVYGFSGKIGLLSFPGRGAVFDLVKPYSSRAGAGIDSEVKEWVDEAYNRTLHLITKHKEQVAQVEGLFA